MLVTDNILIYSISKTDALLLHIVRFYNVLQLFGEEF